MRIKILMCCYRKVLKTWHEVTILACVCVCVSDICERGAEKLTCSCGGAPERTEDGGELPVGERGQKTSSF